MSQLRKSTWVGLALVAITPAAQISFDVQWISSGIRGNDDAVVLGARLFTRFWRRI